MSVTTTTLASWGYAAAQALGNGGQQYRIRKLYIEFENVVSSGDAVSVPTVTADDPLSGIPYYSGLAASPTRDYLRTNLLAAPAIVPASGFESYFPVGQGNMLNLYAQATESRGQNGLAFNASANSKICGIAVVVAPVESDPTQDIIVARSYFTGTDQRLAVDGEQAGISVQVPFVLPQ